ncbi:MAG TPA: NAD(P)-binding domain-containing protein, partial [Saprospiraceae bacterium]|nr:NAD(P)-binding domain-containing protein [Saprospiraceae bacterium]
EGSIRAFFNAELSAIRPAEVDIRTPDGLLTLPNDYVIAATGYLPNFDFLRGMGIELSADEQLRPSYHPDTQESNRPGIYLAGVVCGGMDTHVWFIENSRVHAGAIVQDILKKRKG